MVGGGGYFHSLHVCHCDILVQIVSVVLMVVVANSLLQALDSTCLMLTGIHKQAYTKASNNDTVCIIAIYSIIL